jgi:hypothetical protein
MTQEFNSTDAENAALPCGEVSGGRGSQGQWLWALVGLGVTWRPCASPDSEPPFQGKLQ